MKAVIQRVNSASVTVDGKISGKIDKGLLVLLGVAHNDDQEDVKWLAKKICQLRIFSDAAGLMNANLFDVNGEVLVISQFTLHAKTKKGNRPSYIYAAKPEKAIPLYESFITEISTTAGKEVASGEFGADMKVVLVNDGPVTIIIDTKNKI
ncbi:MAG: D-aminoacyl-tRNA deacylase [Crocinitomicaceae bacterium]